MADRNWKLVELQSLFGSTSEWCTVASTDGDFMLVLRGLTESEVRLIAEALKEDGII